MNTLQKAFRVDGRALLSTLWIFYFLNVLFRDLHQFANADFVQQMLTMDVPEHFLLISAVILELQFLMVIFSRLLPYRFVRWSNMIMAAVTIMIIFSFGFTDLDDIFFGVVEIVTMLFIIGCAWQWREDSAVMLSPA